jgi:hypothetical protein
VNLARRKKDALVAAHREAAEEETMALKGRSSHTHH